MPASTAVRVFRALITTADNPPALGRTHQAAFGNRPRKTIHWPPATTDPKARAYPTGPATRAMEIAISTPSAAQQADVTIHRRRNGRRRPSASACTTARPAPSIAPYTHGTNAVPSRYG